MNFMRQQQLNQDFDQLMVEHRVREIVKKFKYKYTCRSRWCSNTIKSNVALSRDKHFCLQCIK